MSDRDGLLALGLAGAALLAWIGSLIWFIIQIRGTR